MPTGAQLGSWDALAQDQRRWMMLLARSRPEGIRPPDDAPPEFVREPESYRGHRSPSRGFGRGSGRDTSRHLWRRLFLLDDSREGVAGLRLETRFPEHLFDRFYRVQPKADAMPGGAGLGLPIRQTSSCWT